MNQSRHQLASSVFLGCILVFAANSATQAEPVTPIRQGLASWYGEAHRGKLMANGKRFDPDRMTAASWFYPLGTRVRVTVNSSEFETKSVLVTITDRGPAKRFVQQGRIIDLGSAAFRKIAEPDLGLISVSVEAVQ